MRPFHLFRLTLDVEPDDQALMHALRAPFNMAKQHPRKKVRLEIIAGESAAAIQVGRIRKLLKAKTYPENIEVDVIRGCGSNKSYPHHGEDLLSKDELKLINQNLALEPEMEKIANAYKQHKDVPTTELITKPPRELMLSDPEKKDSFLIENAWLANIDALIYAAFNISELVREHMYIEQHAEAEKLFVASSMTYNKLLNSYKKQEKDVSSGSSVKLAELKANCNIARDVLRKAILEREEYRRPMLRKLAERLGAYKSLRIFQRYHILQSHELPKEFSRSMTLPVIDERAETKTKAKQQASLVAHRLAKEFSELLSRAQDPESLCLKQSIRHWNEQMLRTMRDRLVNIRDVFLAGSEATKKQCAEQPAIIKSILDILPKNNDKVITVKMGQQIAPLIQKLDPDLRYDDGKMVIKQFRLDRWRTIALDLDNQHVLADQLVAYGCDHPGGLETVENGENYFDSRGCIQNTHNTHDVTRFAGYPRDYADTIYEALYAEGSLERITFKGQFVVGLKDFAHFMEYMAAPIKAASIQLGRSASGAVPGAGAVMAVAGLHKRKQPAELTPQLDKGGDTVMRKAEADQAPTFAPK